MRNILFYVLTVLGGYLLGCSSMAYYVSRWKKVNLSTNGSGNLGASNTTILLGWRMGSTTFSKALPPCCWPSGCCRT